MSTLKTDTLSNVAGSKSVPTDTVVDGSAKAWVNFNGTGVVAIRRAFNVSSITDNGVGDYTANFTNPMIDAQFAPLQGLGTNVTSMTVTSLSVSTVRFVVRSTSTQAPTDAADIYLAIFS